jgi:hypothetical protein
MSNDNTRGDVMNLHIKSVEELTKFLRLLQEREDPYAEAFKMAFEEDKEQYPLGKNAKGKKNKDEEKNEEENPEVDSDPEQSSETDSGGDVDSADSKTPSLDALIRNINNLRSGQSLKSADVRNEVADYYDNLTEEDQKVLVLFMRELASVVTNQKSGDEASASSNKKDQKEKPTKDPQEDNEQQKDNVPQQSMEDEPTSSSSEPADEPPIKVNESQDMSSINIIFNRLRG